MTNTAMYIKWTVPFNIKQPYEIRSWMSSTTNEIISTEKEKKMHLSGNKCSKLINEK